MELEKVICGQAGSKKAIWTETRSWSGPLREYAQVSSSVTGVIEPWRLTAGIAGTATQAGTILRRLSFFSWEADSLIERLKPSEPSAFKLLCHIFYNELGFSICLKNSHHHYPLNELLLDSVLIRRTAASTVGSMLFSWLAEKVAIQYGPTSDYLRVDLIALVAHEIVRLVPKVEDGTLYLINLKQNARPVPESEWQSWCEKPGAFVRLTWSQGFIRIITELSSALAALTADQTTVSATAQLLLLDQLIALEPSETRRWADRAFLQFRLGYCDKALDDLKRYFAFHEFKSAPRACVDLLNELKSRL